VTNKRQFHHVFRMLLKGDLFTAPVADRLRGPVGPGMRRPRVLDLGTGTGIWAIDVADEFPNADVIANDLSPIQPQKVPENLRFEVDDVESEYLQVITLNPNLRTRIVGARSGFPKTHEARFREV